MSCDSVNIASTSLVVHKFLRKIKEQSTFIFPYQQILARTRWLF